MKKEFTFSESCIYPQNSLPEIDGSGYLEMKRGEMCLRLSDTVTAKSATQFVFTRSWCRPFSKPFNTDLYRIKDNNESRST